MSLKPIDGSNQTMQCEAEAVESTPAPTVAPMACVDRVEQARVEERAYAGEQTGLEGKLRDTFAAVPKPGALELELKMKVLHQGGGAKISAERNESGEFVVRVEGQLQGAVGHHAAVETGAAAAVTYRFRTPEAAADLLTSLAFGAPGGNGQSVDPGHYAREHLEQVEVGVEQGISLHGQFMVHYAEADASLKMTGIVDFNRHMYVIEQAVDMQALKYGSVLLARAGVEGEATTKLRTEVELPDDVLSKLASGEMSAGDVLKNSEATRKLVIESEARGEVHTLFAPAYSYVRKIEAEVDLDQFFSAPMSPELAMKGSIKEMVSNQNAVGVGFDLPNVDVLARGAIYNVSERHLFQHHDEKEMQQELDVKRSLH